MSETSQLGLPLVQPAQAQKHVTVNEALVRLDGLTHLRLLSNSLTTPPITAIDGEAYGVPVGGVNEWSLNVGDVAIFSNGGWVFVTPKEGWRSYIVDQGESAIYSGTGWVASALGISPSGAKSGFEIVEFDHVIGAGATSVTATDIPQYAMVFAVTGRVKTAITGTLTSFDLGVAGFTNRYGGGLGLAQGSWLVGITGQPVTYYANTPLQLTANGGDFTAGELRLVMHYFVATPPGI